MFAPGLWNKKSWNRMPVPAVTVKHEKEFIMKSFDGHAGLTGELKVV